MINVYLLLDWKIVWLPISFRFKVVRDVASRIEEYHFEVLKLKCADDHLMQRVLNYLRLFRKQNFDYRNNNEYRIDNTITERAIRSVVLQRKGSMFFGNIKGISNSEVFNTYFETCMQRGIPFWDYFCRLMREMKKRRTDYENLLTVTLYE